MPRESSRFDLTGLINHPASDNAGHQRRVMYLLQLILARQDKIMLDTSKALAAVRQENTDNASLRALLATIVTELQTTNAALAAAIAAGDPAAIAAAQTDLDTIATLANTDDAQTQAALAANVQPAPAGTTQGTAAGTTSGQTG